MCSAGFACPAGSVADAVVACASGYFCPRGTTNATANTCFSSGTVAAAWQRATAGSGTGAPALVMVGASTSLGPVVWTTPASSPGGVDGDCSPASLRLPRSIDAGLQAVALGDVNLDGLEDAVFVFPNGSVGVSVQGPNTTFGLVALGPFVSGAAVTGGGAGGVTVMDADTDGVVDVVVVGSSGPSALMVGVGVSR